MRESAKSPTPSWPNLCACSSAASSTRTARFMSKSFPSAAIRMIRKLPIQPIHPATTMPASNCAVVPGYRHLLRAGLLATSILSGACLCSAQTPQAQTLQEKKDPVPAPQPATTTKPTGSVQAEAQKPPSLKQAIKKKKVLTEDDLHPKSGRTSNTESGQRDFNPICVPACEQRVRDAMQPDDSSELEFRNKL